MDADEARKATEAATSRTNLEPFLQPIFSEIRKAANGGHRSINLGPWPRPGPTAAQAQAVYQWLKELGYTIKHENDQREGRSWDNVSW
jgi:hypothetical protein